VSEATTSARRVPHVAAESPGKKVLRMASRVADSSWKTKRKWLSVNVASVERLRGDAPRKAR